ncbi:translation elongation factor 4 [Patescibacteria group bacterium]|nr:translation elongation factor 4 [Patescibacteria group bacterium]
MKNQSFIRNFVIISHVNHGKSTLADRFLELTKTIPEEKMRSQYLDLMDLEREKGITIKMQPVRMDYTLNSKSYFERSEKQGSEERSDKGSYILNLIDTPGHVDFSYEVSRSLAAVEGAILLVDATKGIQAQTLANLDLAKKQNLVILPVINKIDLQNAKIEQTTDEIANLLGVEKNEVIKISAKYGTNVEKLLEKIIKKIPPPQGEKDKPLRALIFDSKHDPYKGVICFVRIVDGQIKNGATIYLMAGKIEGKVKELGFFRPEFLPKEKLRSGEIGFVATGIKEAGKVRVGDTITSHSITQPLNHLIEPLAGYKEPKPMVFASFYPENPDDFGALKEALMKLKLNDASLTFEPERKEGLGRGYLCGFLGSLHAEIIAERLKREFGLNLVISTPSVVYRIITQKDEAIFIYSSSDWPSPSIIKEIQEPWVKLEIITPSDYLGRVLEILAKLEGDYIERKYFSQNRLLLTYEVPLREIIVGFYDQILGQTQGYASMNYEILGYRPGNLVKLEILIAGKKEEVFSKIVPKNRTFIEGKKIVNKLKEILPPQLFPVALQAAVSGKIIARATIKAKRRDVIAPLYGGDYTRKRKLLEKQKKGKKKLKEIGKVRVPQNVFFEMFKS